MEQRVGTWGASHAAPTYFIPLDLMPAPAPIQGTIRHRLRVSAGGSRLRLRLSNETGDKPLLIGGASIGLADEQGACIRQGTLRRVSFSQSEAISIPPGAVVVSDPVELSVPHLGEVIVSFYLPEEFIPAQGGDTHKAEIAAGRDAVMAAVLPASTELAARPIITVITVTPLRPTQTIVTLGDSLTDGATEGTGCESYKYRGWPDVLARRLHERPSAMAYGVVNAGIGGNRLLRNFIGPPALARLDGDVFAVPGLSHLIVLEGINDIGIGGRTINGNTFPMATPDELIAAYLQIIERAHEQGVKVIGGTLMPFRDAFFFLEEKESVRQVINTWIREEHAFDGIVDFDQAIRDPGDPSRLGANFDSGDHLHPNAIAFWAMGHAIDLSLFEC